MCPFSNTLRANLTLSLVLFSIGGPTGNIKEINSTATVVDPEHAPAKFEVIVDKQENKTLHAWVIMTGPIDEDTGLYKYCVMSDSLGVDLFILARDVADFQATDQAQVLIEVGYKGFIFPFNRPHQTYQGDQCLYPPMSTPEEE
jgi:hypothetical protein